MKIPFDDPVKVKIRRLIPARHVLFKPGETTPQHIKKCAYEIGYYVVIRKYDDGIRVFRHTNQIRL